MTNILIVGAVIVVVVLFALLSVVPFIRLRENGTPETIRRR